MAGFNLAKGVKDWYGKDAILRNEIRETLRGIFERYGFNPLETPMIERKDTIGYKGGGEIQKEVFQLQDQGKRDLALRFDQTLPLARFAATQRDLKLPFKRYAIGEVFRDGPTQPEQGRYRIFTQCDVDMLGIKDMSAEAELFALADDAFNELGLGNVEVKINNRKLLDGVLDHAGVPDFAKLRTIVTLDKMDKIGLEGVRDSLYELRLSDRPVLSDDQYIKITEAYNSQGMNAIEQMKDELVSTLSDRGYQEICSMLRKGDHMQTGSIDNYAGPRLLDDKSVDRLMDVISDGGGNSETLRNLEKLIRSDKGKEGLSEVRTLLDYSEKMGIDSVQLDPSLARGLDYYTGTTIEVYLNDRDLCRSAILAGGRFDDMVGDFRGGEDIPAVGFSFGLERLAMIIGESRETKKNVTDLYVIPIGGVKDDCLALCSDLRGDGLNVDMEHCGRKVGASIQYADQSGIRYVALVGDDELKQGKLTVKDLTSGVQQTLGRSEVKDYIR